MGATGRPRERGRLSVQSRAQRSRLGARRGRRGYAQRAMSRADHAVVVRAPPGAAVLGPLDGPAALHTRRLYRQPDATVLRPRARAATVGGRRPFAAVRTLSHGQRISKRCAGRGVRSHSSRALSHSSCAGHPGVPAPSCRCSSRVCDKRRLHGTRRADRRTFCGIFCRMAQVLWDNPLTIYGIRPSLTPGIGTPTVGSYTVGANAGAGWHASPQDVYSW